jgi:hypothetical protein
MAKRVTLKARIDAQSKVHAKPEGTQNEECLDLMQFLDKIPGLFVEETTRTDDMGRGGHCLFADSEIED